MDREPDSTSNAAVEEARALLQRNQPAEAAQVMRAQLRRHAGTAAEHMLLGVALARAGESFEALEALEQAVSLEPQNATARFNLGQVYREFGRRREALAEFECAVSLRPDYAAAIRAAEELRQPTQGAAAAGSTSPGLTSPTGSLSASPFSEPGSETANPQPATVLEAAGQLILRPEEAVNGGLDSYFNTRGAVGAVIAAFVLSTAVAALGASLMPGGSTRLAGAEMLGNVPFVILSSIVSVLTTAGAIAAYNRLTSGSDDFFADFGSLALSFALISATVTFVTAPITTLAALAGASPVALSVLFLGPSLWKLYLQVKLVSAATDIDTMPAIGLLFGASFIASFAAGLVAGALRGAP